MINHRTVLTVAIACLWTSAAQADIFSPGPLAKPHSSLEGLSKCSVCHASGGDEDHFQQKCLACHVELAPRVAKGAGFHGRLTEEKRDCKLCHLDHQGVDFKMIEWAPSKDAFPHSETGWPLKGAHAKVKCADCHELKRVEAAEIRKWLDQHPQTETFLGLPEKCSACHFDEHRQQLGDKCEQCHVEKSWSPAPGFDHAKTDYPLSGKHKDVTCLKCHELKPDTTTPATAFPAPVKKQFAQYSSVEHQSCLDCHQDPHQGSFGDACSSCHVTDGWKIIHTAESQRAFHDKTRFPLRGAHAEVDCKSCHGPFPGRAARFKGLAFQVCADCHMDAHEGQFAGMPGKGACEGCHTVNGFMPPRFELEDHQKTRYPLEGPHAAVACASCHPKQPELEGRIPASVFRLLHSERRQAVFSLTSFQFQKPTADCESCHRDPHAAQFHAADDHLACTRCHRVSSFGELTFDHDKDSRFPLTGAHAKATCAQCHLSETIKGAVATRYRPIDQRCSSCHADAHAGQFHKPGAPDQPEDCADCHTTTAFKQATRFTHTPPFTSYLLEGKHAEVKCESCHQVVAVKPGVEVRKYVGLPSACSGCHQDFHHGEFKQFVQ